MQLKTTKADKTLSQNFSGYPTGQSNLYQKKFKLNGIPPVEKLENLFLICKLDV